ncbi:Hypothetical predicted protein [Mytilus galloprovincialis]|uniref:SAM domain-containing protein n=1 Tax=Mytilus galloprovincialis TaxID=29158 RepID=A0A8B6CFX5_MYTGA|nr:Hypothetical predicted protein [Mytilus galloprovincialis]
MADPPVQVETGVIKDHGMHLGDEDFHAEESQHRLVDPGYIGVRLPSRPRRPKRHHSRKRKSKPKIEATPTSLTPSEQIQALITENEEESHDVFCQLDTLFKLGNESQWREAARWVKYEEDVEDSGNRWSKPHVASLSLHSLFELRSQLLNGAVMLDMDAYHISQVSELLIDNLIANKLLEDTMRDDIKQTILSPHIHAHLKRRKTQADDLGGRKKSIARTFSEIGRSFSKTNTRAPLEDSVSHLKGNPNSVPNMERFQVNGGLKESPSSAKHHAGHHHLNQPFMKKIPDGAEAANIWVGEMDALKYPVTAFIRLSEARPIGDLTEVPLPTRFLFIHLGPPGTAGKCLETGRAISTIMVDEVFREVAYKARNRQDILNGIDEFLDQVTVLPPGEWDPKIRIEPPTTVPSQQGRKENKPQPAGPKEAALIIEEEESHVDPTLVRTGRNNAENGTSKKHIITNNNHPESYSSAGPESYAQTEVVTDDEDGLQHLSGIAGGMPMDAKKKSGLRRFLGKLKRSGSQDFHEREKTEQFKRGGVRATASGRLGWSKDTKVQDNTPFARWDSDRVTAWMNEIGLNMYLVECRKYIKNGDQMLKFTSHDLEKELGIKNYLHRKKLQLALQSISANSAEKFNFLDHNWVTRWLDDIGLPQYKDYFYDARIDGRMLHFLTIDDLVALKVTNELHHISIRRGIQILRAHSYNPQCLRRRPSPDEGHLQNIPGDVALWTNHRVMEWLRTIDLSEYAPNMRGSGVHGALMVLEPRFCAELFAQLLSIPSNKTLLRRHLNTHFIALIGNDTQHKKREHESNPAYIPLLPNAKVKVKKHGIFGHKRSKSDAEADDFLCPIDFGNGRMVNGRMDPEVTIIEELIQTSHHFRITPVSIIDALNNVTFNVLRMKDQKAAKEIGAFSKEINSLTVSMIISSLYM